MEKKWVQHKSGEGEKYKVRTQFAAYWEASDNSQDHWYLRLPIKDYVPCDPPQKWEKVPLDIYAEKNLVNSITDEVLASLPSGYRWVNVPGPPGPVDAFTIERLE